MVFLLQQSKRSEEQDVSLFTAAEIGATGLHSGGEKRGVKFRL